MKNIKLDYPKETEEMENEYTKYLKPLGIKMPNPDTKAYAWLLCLYLNKGKVISKEAIAKFVQCYHPNAAGDQQVRHLNDPRFGWGFDVRGSGRSDGRMPDGSKVPQGYYILVSMTSPHPQFYTRPKSKGICNKIKKDLQNNQNRCQACGKTCQELGISKLDIGHMDGDKALTSDNAILICVYCNNWQLNDAAIDNNGKITHIKSTRFIKNSPDYVKEKLLEYLLDWKHQKQV